MDNSGIAKLDAPEGPEMPPQSTTTKSSLVGALFTRGPTHASRSSISTTSLASSPLPRDSFDLYTSRLGRVTEEPLEKGDLDGYTLVDCGCTSETVAASLAEALRASAMDIHQSSHHEPEELLQATTPLLPPAFSDLSLQGSSLYDSPLQSPSIAPTQPFPSYPRNIESSTVTSLPSPPLSSKPSMVSMRQASRANTGATIANADIPPLRLIDEVNDPWAQSLGHANFSIQPEPYFPEHIDLSSYQEFRSNWDQARTNYTKHLARTIEHNGATSKVSKLTKEKWTAIDTKWKDYNESLTVTLSPVLKKISNSDSDKPDSQASTVLEKPPPNIVIPAIHDKGGKFPELGDGDIVGPMAVAPAKSPDLTTPPTTPTSPRRRHLFKFLTDMLKGT
ncbi:hypothetical protein DV737_g4398, partial [Chaetothyriales sp. CBS 132003]